MSATLSNAIKALIEAAGLSLTAVRDDWGDGTPLSTRYVTISEGVAVNTDRLSGEHGDDPVIELVQVDLWQPWRVAPGSGDPAEDYSVPGALYDLLHGARLPTAPTLVRSCTVDSMVRLVERDSNVVHHAFTLRIRRER